MISEKDIILSNGREVILKNPNKRNRRYLKAEWDTSYRRIINKYPITIQQKETYERLWKKLTN